MALLLTLACSSRIRGCEHAASALGGGHEVPRAHFTDGNVELRNALGGPVFSRAGPHLLSAESPAALRLAASIHLFTFPTALGDRPFHAHFTEGETEAQRD